MYPSLPSFFLPIYMRILFSLLFIAVISMAAVFSLVGADAKKGPKVLIVGGNKDHDFQSWFNKADVATLSGAGVDVAYTEDMQVVAKELPGLDVLYMSNNQPVPAGDLRKAIFNHVESGKGLLL